MKSINFVCFFFFSISSAFAVNCKVKYEEIPTYGYIKNIIGKEKLNNFISVCPNIKEFKNFKNAVSLASQYFLHTKNKSDLSKENKNIIKNCPYLKEFYSYSTSLLPPLTECHLSYFLNRTLMNKLKRFNNRPRQKPLFYDNKKITLYLNMKKKETEEYNQKMAVEQANSIKENYLLSFEGVTRSQKCQNFKASMHNLSKQIFSEFKKHIKSLGAAINRDIIRAYFFSKMSHFYDREEVNNDGVYFYYQTDNIDYNLKDTSGRTNKERLEMGLNPITRNKKGEIEKMEWHHVTQDQGPNSPVILIPKSQHTPKIHPWRNEASKINREIYNTRRVQANKHLYKIAPQI